MRQRPQKKQLDRRLLQQLLLPQWRKKLAQTLKLGIWTALQLPLLFTLTLLLLLVLLVLCFRGLPTRHG